MPQTSVLPCLPVGRYHRPLRRTLVLQEFYSSKDVTPTGFKYILRFHFSGLKPGATDISPLRG